MLPYQNYAIAKARVRDAQAWAEARRSAIDGEPHLKGGGTAKRRRWGRKAPARPSIGAPETALI